ncbi:hypothetical protein GpartN1_g3164.t1 [Galdieria partita]|uniref:Inositol-1-monophosphatase n=1 Tax=Galdieria partita TaxID=83374 RepID=A0A9C7PV05_9RHOD|nr:hypothetical protein GpartN1_g3164.t1 [Galdieria partita]
MSSICSDEQDYTMYLNTAMAIVEEAGNRLSEEVSHKGSRPFRVKTTDADLVSATDISIQEYVFACLRESFPGHSFFGEENAGESENWRHLLDHGFVWVLDPVDGTTNWIHNFPFVCISLALVVEGIVQVAVVYDVYRKKLFHACRGKGAFCNDKVLNVSTVERLKEALVITEFGYVRDESGLSTILNVLHTLLLYGAHGIRQTGCGVLDLCLLASGQVDALYAGVGGEGWKPWDYAAGYLIVKEAGGTICSLDNDEFHLCSASIVCACSSSLAFELRKVILQTKE